MLANTPTTTLRHVRIIKKACTTMIKLTPALILAGSVLLAGCDMELSQEAKSKVEETTQEANASVEALTHSVNSEMEKAKQSALTSTLSEETNKQIDSVKQKAEEIGNMKVSELLSFGGDNDAESESEEN